MKKNIIVGLHTYIHDGSMCTYNLDNHEIKYIKFERLTEKKHQCHNDPSIWIKYLNHLGYNHSQVKEIFVTEVLNLRKGLQGKDIGVENLPQNMMKYFDSDTRLFLVDHHTAHFYSAGFINGLVVDDMGSQWETMTIFKKKQPRLKLDNFIHGCLGRHLDYLWWLWFLKDKGESIEMAVDKAGHTMALHGFGHDFSNKIEVIHYGNGYEAFINFKEKFKDKQNVENNYVTSLHHYYHKKIRNHLKRIFNKNEHITFTGGVGHNIILNTFLKNDFPNFEPQPHCGDEGLSIGALRWGLKSIYGLRLKFSIEEMKQHDDNFGYAKKDTIKKVAEFLSQNKLVMWGQGWGELGPRALGFRSILMNPCAPNAKDIINEKIKKRVWFRPYGASVPVDSCKNYFEFEFESPWMLFQAKVKDPIKFSNITHVDGTCRIQTVKKEVNPPYYGLLKDFENLTGYPILINTSMNVPGKPIVGTRKQAKIMFDKSQADVLVIGDKIYTK